MSKLLHMTASDIVVYQPSSACLKSRRGRVVRMSRVAACPSHLEGQSWFFRNRNDIMENVIYGYMRNQVEASTNYRKCKR